MNPTGGPLYPQNLSTTGGSTSDGTLYPQNPQFQQPSAPPYNLDGSPEKQPPENQPPRYDEVMKEREGEGNKIPQNSIDPISPEDTSLKKDTSVKKTSHVAIWLHVRSF